MIAPVPFLPAALFGLPTWAANLILVGVVLVAAAILPWP